MLRPRFNQSGIRHSLRSGAAPKAQNEIEESQRKRYQEEGQCKDTSEERQRPKKTTTGQCERIDEKTHKKGLHNRETPSTILIFLGRHVSGVVAPLGNQGGHVGREGRIETDELPCARMHEA